MDSTKIKAKMAEGGRVEPLVITKEGDVTQGVIERGGEGSSVVITQSCSGESAPGEKRKVEDKNGDRIETEMCLKDKNLGAHQPNTEDNQKGDVTFDEGDQQKDDKPEGTDNMNGQNKGESENEGQTWQAIRIKQNSQETSGKEDPQVDISGLTLSEQQQQPEGTKSQNEDPKKAHRLTPDFPDSLYDLLCTFQEGRRLNDQRCSFMLEDGVRRRRCHSEPNTNKPAKRVIFSSMTSLQREEFFELVATSQARRLDDQRSQLERSPAAKQKFRSFRGSIKQLSFVRKPAPAPAPVPVPKEDLYNMIRTTQAQGRMEDQRSRAPGPMDDEDFFSLLLRVQGGRIDEQRTELPFMLQT